jgi:hypothetical protein
MEESNNATNITVDPLAEWQLDPSLNNIALGMAWSIVAVVTVSVNMFICIYTIMLMTKKKSLKTSSNYTSQSSLLLFNLAMSFVIEGIFALPFIVVAISSGEWLAKESTYAKMVTCGISGFILTITYTVGLHTLAAISIERFLFVSKPHIHKRRFNNKVIFILIIVLWIYCFFLASTPFFNFGGYTFYTKGGICIPPINDRENRWLILYVMYSVIPIVTIIVMIIATFVFARRFARQMKSSRKAAEATTSINFDHPGPSWQQKSSPNRNSVVIINYRNQNGSMTEKKKNYCICGKKCFTLYGVFAALVILYGIQLVAGIVSAIVTIPTGTEFQPAQLQATSTFLTVALPAITGVFQVYFRPEFRHALYWLLRCLVCLRKSPRPWESTIRNYRSQASVDSRDNEVGVSPNNVSKEVKAGGEFQENGYSPELITMETSIVSMVGVVDTGERLEEVTHGYNMNGFYEHINHDGVNCGSGRYSFPPKSIYSKRQSVDEGAPTRKGLDKKGLSSVEQLNMNDQLKKKVQTL